MHTEHHGPLTWPTRGRDDVSSRFKWGSNGCKWTECPSWAWLVCPGGPSFPLAVNCAHGPNQQASPPIWPPLGDNPAASLIQYKVSNILKPALSLLLNYWAKGGITSVLHFYGVWCSKGLYSNDFILPGKQPFTILEMTGGDGCIIRIYWMPLKCTKNG